MKKALVVVLCVGISLTAFASDNGYKVTYDGGSLTEQKPGTGMKLFIESNQIRMVKDKAEIVSIPVAAVTEISYGQDVHRRVGRGHRPRYRIFRDRRINGAN